MSAKVVPIAPAHAKRRGRASPPSRAFLRLFPCEWSRLPGPWLYAVGLRDGRVKVGYASQPRERISHYCVAHEGIAWAHLFARVVGGRRAAKAIERRALTLLSVVSTRTERHSEYFRGADKATVLRIVRQAYAMVDRLADSRDLGGEKAAAVG